MREEVYDIGGMHCAACSSSVERVTRKLPGVQRSDVNLPMNRLTIAYDEARCSPEDIIRKVEKAGFTASPHEKRGEAAAKPEDDGAALKKEKTGLIVSACFAGLLLLVSMGHMLIPGFPLPELFSPETYPVNLALLEMLLCIPVLFIGRRFFTGGFASLFHGSPNMDTLVALSATASFLYSLVMTFLISDDPMLVHSLYYESAAVIVALVSVGKYLEAGSKEKTKAAIKGLMELRPDTALLVDENGQWEVPATMIKVGDTVLVKPGERVPLDGVVSSGSGSVNEAMLTGESLPVTKSEGSQVIGGSVSVDGALYVRVSRVGEDTALSKIIRFVEDAQGKKAPIARTADKVSGIFVPVVMAVAAVSAAVWLILGKEFSFALNIFTSVLVIACPCAMGLATPTAIIVGTGLGARHGILIRSGEALEICHKADVVIMDKTGTVTEGRPEVTDIVSGSEAELLKTAFALEALSAHPLAEAICAEARSRGLGEPEPVTDFENVSGRGISARDVGGIELLAGSAAFMEERGLSCAAYKDELSQLQGQGKTAVLVSRGGELLGLMALADSLKPDSAGAVSRLKEMGIKTVLLTGDNRAAAEYIGSRIGVDSVEAEVLPIEKAEAVRRWQQSGHTVMMVGDGINDAPALTQADVGCAIGGGSDIAVDSGDIVLMSGRLADVPGAIRLSRLTIRNIRQNLFWAFCYNTLGIPIAAGLLYPSLGLLLSPMIGALAMSLSSLFVVTNALRLKGKKI